MMKKYSYNNYETVYQHKQLHKYNLPIKMACNHLQACSKLKLRAINHVKTKYCLMKVKMILRIMNSMKNRLI